MSNNIPNLLGISDEEIEMLIGMGVQIVDALRPYDAHAMITDFLSQLNDHFIDLRVTATAFARSIEISTATSNILAENLMELLIGLNAVFNVLNRTWECVDVAVDYNNQMLQITNNYVQGTVMLLNNNTAIPGALTPFDLLRLYDFSYTLFGNVNTMGLDNDYVLETLGRGLEYFRRAISEIFRSNDPNINLNIDFWRILSLITTLINNHISIQATYGAFYVSVMSLFNLVVDFIRSWHNYRFE